MKFTGLAFVFLLLFCVAREGHAQTNQRPQLGEVAATRWVLSHGRYDKVRAAGIKTPENPDVLASVVTGVTPFLPESQAVPTDALPSDAKFSILDWVASQPNKLAITLAAAAGAESALVLVGSRIPSCFTLVVAEGASDPDGDPVGIFWHMPRPRFGGGNFYATVSIPDGDGNPFIYRGMELVTPKHFEFYTANSVLYEAPDVGLAPHIQDYQLDGGTKRIVAEAVDDPVRLGDGSPRRPHTRSAPPVIVWGASKKSSPPKSRLIGYADPIAVEIVVQEQISLPNGAIRVKAFATLDNSFEAVAETYFRWAIETDTETAFEEIAASPVLVFDLVEPSPQGGVAVPGGGAGGAGGAEPAGGYGGYGYVPQVTTNGGLVKLTLVASSYGPGVPAAPPTVPPFVRKIGELGTAVSMDSFVSVACTLSDTETLSAEPDSTKKGVSHSICILLDASGSMKDNNKMEKAKASATRVLGRLAAHTEVALIVFYGCGNIVVEHDFSTEHSKVISILPRVQPSGGTPLAAGTSFAKEYLRKNASGAKLDLIVLTDGKESCSGDPIAAARS